MILQKLFFLKRQKVYEKFILEMFKPFINSFYQHTEKRYSTNHVLVRLIENWKKALDEKILVGTVLMDLSKAFDCIPHDLLIAKLHAYGFSQKTVASIYLYLKRRKQKVKVNIFLSYFLRCYQGYHKGLY